MTDENPRDLTHLPPAVSLEETVASGLEDPDRFTGPEGADGDGD